MGDDEAGITRELDLHRDEVEGEEKEKLMFVLGGLMRFLVLKNVETLGPCEW